MMKESIDQFISNSVENYYRNHNLNCAQTTLLILAENFDTKLNEQVLKGAIGLNGAGQYRAQCGLVEGVLIFLGIYLQSKGINEKNIQEYCHLFATKFENKFGSLSCYHLRPGGFQPNDPPLLCENLTKESIKFSVQFIADI